MTDWDRNFRKLLRRDYARAVTPLLIRRPSCPSLSDHGTRELLEEARAKKDSSISACLLSSIFITAHTTTTLIAECFATVHPLHRVFYVINYAGIADAAGFGGDIACGITNIHRQIEAEDIGRRRPIVFVTS